MKVKTSITKCVKEATALCRETVTEAIIGLMEQIGTQPGQTVKFDELLVLTTIRNRKGGFGIETETIYADGMAYQKSSNGNQFFGLEYEDKGVVTSTFLSNDQLLQVYNTVRKIVSEY